MTTFVERSIEVAVPVRTAYDQWTQFEEFPRFMAGVTEVRQIGDALTHWVAEFGGVRREWDAAILEQVPDEKVAWAATTGATNAGAVYFTAVGDDRTRVRLTLEFEPEGIVERIADVFDIVDRQAVADLDRFKDFIEQAGAATGGWRGTVDDGTTQDGERKGGYMQNDEVQSGAGTDFGATVGAEALEDKDSGRAEDVSGDVVAAGPTGGTRGTVDTEAGPSHAGVADDQGAGVGHSGDPVAVDSPDTSGSSEYGATGSAWPTAGAATSSTVDSPDTSGSSEYGATGSAGPTVGAATSSASTAGFGTNTGMSSDEPASGGLTGDPQARTTGRAGSDDSAFGAADATGRGDAYDGFGQPGVEDRDTTDLVGGTPSRTEPSTLESLDAPGAADGVGGGLDPLDPRVGTADDPNNPQQPSV